jgi:NhaA family Na+:H+ antiporter
MEVTGSVVLRLCTVVAMVWAISARAVSYSKLWQTEFAVSLAGLVLAKPLILWIDKRLIAVFLLAVFMQIQRELLVGEPSDPRQAASPVAATLGGLLLPAAIFTVFNLGTLDVWGWYIHRATDIAFAIGHLTLLDRRIPTFLKIFLATLAIVDDIGAILVIAILYTANIAWICVGIIALILPVLMMVGRAGLSPRFMCYRESVSGLPCWSPVSMQLWPEPSWLWLS